MKKSLIMISVAVLALVFLQSLITPLALAAKKNVIIGYYTKPGKQDEDDIRAKGGKVKHRYGIVPAIAAEVEEAEVDKIRKQSKVKYVEPDYTVHAIAIPTDPMYSNLWGMRKIQAPEAWDMGRTGSHSVVIAVIDTGVDYNHEDLAANMWENVKELGGISGMDDDGNGKVDDIYGYDFYNNDSDPWDDHGHGTHCSGTIGAMANNDKGVVGVNWNVKIMALKFLGGSASGPYIRCSGSPGLYLEYEAGRYQCDRVQ